MAWIELKLQTSAQRSEDIAALLETIGALAVTTQDAGDQPLYEPLPGTTPIWDNVIITGLFDEKIDIATILATIKSQFPDTRPAISRLEDQQWERTWMVDFQPMKFGQRLWIIPSYHDVPPSHNQVILDPGLAFGTGKHPTTALCLQWLDSQIQGNEILIDYGCGSGILGIAALKLGAAKVFAIDHDPQAILATKENADRNNLTEEQIVILHPSSLNYCQADILIANILANPLIELVEQFASMLLPQGRIALSGILSEQGEEVAAAYQPWFDIRKIEQLEGWVRIDGVRRK